MPYKDASAKGSRCLRVAVTCARALIFSSQYCTHLVRQRLHVFGEFVQPVLELDVSRRGRGLVPQSGLAC